MVQQECFPYDRGNVVCAYGKNMPCCPDCGQKMKVHGTCKRNVRTAQDPDGKQYRLRVLICRPCGKTHRELPDFVVPHKGYSYDYMVAVAMGTEKPQDNRKKEKIIHLLCALLLFTGPWLKSVAPKAFLRNKSRNSTDMQFSKEQKCAILSAIRGKGVASDEIGTKLGRSRFPKRAYQCTTDEF